jgi:hypothetical protein
MCVHSSSAFNDFFAPRTLAFPVRRNANVGQPFWLSGGENKASVPQGRHQRQHTNHHPSATHPTTAKMAVLRSRASRRRSHTKARRHEEKNTGVAAAEEMAECRFFGQDEQDGQDKE